nr:MAG TPA: hypothetical protein [Caudoviricetes sp.]
MQCKSKGHALGRMVQDASVAENQIEAVKGLVTPFF